MSESLTPKKFKKKYMPNPWNFPIAARESGKIIMDTQRFMGTVYAQEFYELLKLGERLTEQDYTDGLKEVYVGVGKMFCGGY